MERRVLGSIDGSSRPACDSGLCRRGRLLLETLASHHPPLDEVVRGFDLMRIGEALQVVLDLAPEAA